VNWGHAALNWTSNSFADAGGRWPEGPPLVPPDVLPLVPPDVLPLVPPDVPPLVLL
jgi:hypothetical protein